MCSSRRSNNEPGEPQAVCADHLSIRCGDSPRRRAAPRCPGREIYLFLPRSPPSRAQGTITRLGNVPLLYCFHFKTATRYITVQRSAAPQQNKQNERKGSSNVCV